MLEGASFADRVLEFHDRLSRESPSLPTGFKIINPFEGGQNGSAKRMAARFYKMYYDDNCLRRLILGSTPARRGSALTGVPFEDVLSLESATGEPIAEHRTNRTSSGFLHEVIRDYGGREKFYGDFYMNFVCPVGIVRTSAKGNEVNCDYFANERLRKSLDPLIVSAMQIQMSLGIDTSICYCIGSGENFRFLSRLNEAHGWFSEISPLEHPRFIMQYNANRKDFFLEKYLVLLRGETS